MPLNTVRFTPVLDDANSAQRGKPFLVPLVLQDETGADARPKRLHGRGVLRRGQDVAAGAGLLNLVAALHHPADAESVSLRASATDRDGNTVKQTLIRAYKLRK